MNNGAEIVQGVKNLLAYSQMTDKENEELRARLFRAKEIIGEFHDDLSPTQVEFFNELNELLAR